ncbi:hypothetical protein [Bdellovibrio bacteriovorus]|uniref:hypothetical protein n=1 Tax=Bdellovibrio bacteriovorus TaxID=959 RepID=UPI0003178C27|nr:hypothetical protein [Bdellovibrio bacteriovorus]
MKKFAACVIAMATIQVQAYDATTILKCEAPDLNLSLKVLADLNEGLGLNTLLVATNGDVTYSTLGEALTTPLKLSSDGRTNLIEKDGKYAVAITQKNGSLKLYTAHCE